MTRPYQLRFVPIFLGLVSSETVKSRAPNWPTEQLQRLIELYVSNKAVLDGKFSTGKGCAKA